MAVILYNSFLFLFGVLIWLSALWDAKSLAWVRGRKKWRRVIKQSLTPDQKNIWIHAASLGEFEQGRPLLEEIRKQYPHYRIVLTFFSPSGYAQVKNDPLADHVFYLPLDGRKRAKDFIELVNPVLAIFIKYEFWYHYYTTLKEKGIPNLLVSAAFRKSQPFFKWWGGLFRKMLTGNIMMFVQDERSRELLSSIAVTDNVIVAGDTRYDRVAGLRDAVRSNVITEKFREGKKLLIAGSTWPGDEKILKNCLAVLPADWKMVIAPHEIDSGHIIKLQALFKEDMVLYSTASAMDTRNKKILVVDNVGLLSSLYSYGDIAYIGGGFQKGIHNTLEPAVFGLPVIFGPRYSKYVEAVRLVEKGFAFPVRNSTEASQQLNDLISNPDKRQKIHQSVRDFMQGNTGATSKIMSYIKDKGLL